jgi:hypothetical protein
MSLRSSGLQTEKNVDARGTIGVRKHAVLWTAMGVRKHAVLWTAMGVRKHAVLWTAIWGHDK